MAFKTIYQAKKIVEDILAVGGENQASNLDYAIGVNTLVALIMLKIGKLWHALEFIKIAEKNLVSLIELNLIN